MRECLDRIRYLIMLTNSILNVYSYKYINIWKSKFIQMMIYLPLKILHIHNALILIKSDFNETYKHYYYKVILEKISNK